MGKGKTQNARTRKQASTSARPDEEVETAGKGKRRQSSSRSEPPKKRGKALNPSTDLSEEQRLAVYNEMKKKLQAEQNLQATQEAQGRLLVCHLSFILSGSMVSN
jgi:hypothetical protein